MVQVNLFNGTPGSRGLWCVCVCVCVCGTLNRRSIQTRLCLDVVCDSVVGPTDLLLGGSSWGDGGFTY